MKTCLLGIDIGTSACKAALFFSDGTVTAQAHSEYAVSYPRPGWAEQDPEDWWQGVCGAVRQVIKTGRVSAADIAAVGVDGQSWSAVAVDGNGRSLCKTPIWTDTRAVRECEEIRAKIPERILFELSGNPVHPSYTFPKILWYRNNLPDVYRRAKLILQSNSYIVMRLTGKATQDRSQGYGLSCYNMRNGEWDMSIAQELGIRQELLPPLVDCHQVVGQVSRGAALETGLSEGTPVVAGGLDAACGTLGAGVHQPGETQEQGGQAGGMSICLDYYVSDPKLILSAHVVPGRWLLQGGTTGGGGALKWLREQVCPELGFDRMSELAGDVPAGSEGLLFLPYMAGERSPIWNPGACGVFFGIAYSKTRAHLIRAVMEGVGYALRHNMDTAVGAGVNPRILRAMGGSANSLVWTQIKSDITGLEIEVPSSDTATTLGAAILAGVGCGVYSDFPSAVAKTIAVRRRHTPDAGNRYAYETGYARYLELYRRLETMMDGGRQECEQ